MLSPPASDNTSLPRGIPAASLKGRVVWKCRAVSRSLPRGIPAASLKVRQDPRKRGRERDVFRGEYPRPH